jgi:hypothetical protein
MAQKEIKISSIVELVSFFDDVLTDLERKSFDKETAIQKLLKGAQIIIELAENGNLALYNVKK